MIKMAKLNTSKQNCQQIFLNMSVNEPPNFGRKYYLITELFILQYQYSITKYLPSNMTHETMRRWLVKHQTSSVQLCCQLTVWPSAKYITRFGRICRNVCTAARFMMSVSWSHTWLKSVNISTRYLSMKRSSSGVHIFELVFKYMEDIWTQTFAMFDVCTHVHTNCCICCMVAIVDTLCFRVISLNPLLTD